MDRPSDRAWGDRVPVPVRPGELGHPAFPYGAITGPVHAHVVEQGLIGVLNVNPPEQRTGEILEPARDRRAERQVPGDVLRVGLVRPPTGYASVGVGDR